MLRPQSAARMKFAELFLYHLYELPTGREIFEPRPGDDDHAHAIFQGLGDNMVGLVSILRTAGDAIGSQKDTEVQRPVANLCKEPAHLHAADRLRPVLTFDENDRV